MTKKSRALKYVAYHEAGHAVVALAVGERIGRVWVDGRIGSARVLATDHPSQLAADFARAIALLAGPLAQARCQHVSVVLAMVMSSGPGGDCAKLRALVPDLGAQESVERSAIAVVRHEWRAISRVAEALLKRGSLTAAEVRGLRASAGRRRSRAAARRRRRG
ncbi:MAG TPA: hypothetical protein VGL61_06575 [Kofleriaceae bacterium]|jgi:hypothetical protein